ncbi:tetratricopeptide repeat protein [Candidatus Poribacteria bacterium]|nr:tetratricopeptide repeat protein [Candidatus Poribacteria bacterium]
MNRASLLSIQNPKHVLNLDRGSEIRNVPSISLCMIARNEEAFLADCLNSVHGIVNEIILVDTGSQDSTPDIASRFGARVIHHPWNDDFSDARNRSIENATGEWILVLDADEIIAARDAAKIRTLAQGDADGCLFTYRNYSQDSHDIRWVANDGSYAEGNGWDGWISGRVVRMFRRDYRIRFQGAVHETVDQAIRSYGGRIASTDIIIHHYHERKGKQRLREKQLSYLRLCEKSLVTNPNSPKTHFDMGLIYRYVLNDVPKAISHQEHAIRLNPQFEDAHMELALLYHLNNETKNTAKEISFLLGHNPNHAPALLLCGIILERRGSVDRAIECYGLAIKANPNLVDARLNLGALCLRKGDMAGARNEWKVALELNPSNPRALLNLGALELRAGNEVVAERLLGKALEQSSENALAWSNMGVLFARTGRHEQAREAFEKAVALDPSREDIRRNLKASQNNIYGHSIR